MTAMVLRARKRLAVPATAGPFSLKGTVMAKMDVSTTDVKDLEKQVKRAIVVLTLRVGP